MDFCFLLEKLLGGTHLEEAESTKLMELLFDEEVDEPPKAAALALLRVKGASAQELAAFAHFLRSHSNVVQTDVSSLVDTCGTGGGSPSFNLSTASAVVAASAGAFVAKHGNRAVTSKFGGADVLEACGVRLHSDPAALKISLEKIRLAFLFAPEHHPIMKRLGALRRSIGFKTVFNQLGPLANPFNARRQLLGVFERDMLVPMAEALRLLSAERAMVVHSSEGLDEVSPCGPTFCAELKDGVVVTHVLTPADFGLQPLDPVALLPGETLSAAKAIIEDAVSPSLGDRGRATLPNAASALYLAGVVKTLPEGAERAADAIRSGLAAKTLEDLVTASREVTSAR